MWWEPCAYSLPWAGITIQNFPKRVPESLFLLTLWRPPTWMPDEYLPEHRGVWKVFKALALHTDCNFNLKWFYTAWDMRVCAGKENVQEESHLSVFLVFIFQSSDDRVRLHREYIYRENDNSNILRKAPHGLRRMEGNKTGRWEMQTRRCSLPKAHEQQGFHRCPCGLLLLHYFHLSWQNWLCCTHTRCVCCDWCHCWSYSCVICPCQHCGTLSNLSPGPQLSWAAENRAELPCVCKYNRILHTHQRRNTHLIP